jgi:hypothetical protein
MKKSQLGSVVLSLLIFAACNNQQLNPLKSGLNPFGFQNQDTKTNPVSPCNPAIDPDCLKEDNPDDPPGDSPPPGGDNPPTGRQNWSGQTCTNIHPSQNPLGLNDPLVNCQWFLVNGGQTIKKLINWTYYQATPSFTGVTSYTYGGNYGNYSVAPTYGNDMNGLTQWHTDAGQGVQVLVTDDSFPQNHEDFAANYNKNLSRNCFSFNNDPINSGPNYDHGIQTAGMIGAIANNGIGVAGIAPSSDMSGYNAFGCQSVVPSAFLDALEMPAEIDITNHSYGKTGTCASYIETTHNNAGQPEIDLDLLNQAATQRGVLVIKSSGNGRRIRDNCGVADANRTRAGLGHLSVHVAAYAGLDGKITNYSTHGANVFVAGAAGYGGQASIPVNGVPQQSLSYNGEPGTVTLYRGNHYTARMNGTSAAAPSVSGVTAGFLSKNLNLGVPDMMQILAKTAVPANQPMTSKTIYQNGKALNNNSENFYNYCTNALGYQHSMDYGFGRVADYDAAVELALSYQGNLPLPVKYSEEFNVAAPANNQSTSIAPQTCITRSITYNNDFQIWSGEFAVDLTGPIKDVHTRVKLPHNDAICQITRTSTLTDNSISFRNRHKVVAPFGTEANAGAWEFTICNDSLSQSVQFNGVMMDLWGYTENLILPK